ncbi:TELO2-interacting protein 1 homolog [Vigna radiata var. radiata]|uniref:TELO2-interacting protein 1 homolog n=1 Tax=Vigna radiata var. radiata TaxID=3916 RepID=A0A1S3TB38_VIGRR|nr:TELO2-interacting protein 1 homolog [Vigna radiata var. radiata]
MDKLTQEEVETDQLKSSTFQRLKSHSLHLLDLLQNPHIHNQKHSSVTVIPQLLRFLQTSSPSALQPFFDYALFPLLLLLDAAVQCRSTLKIDSQPGVLKTPVEVSDGVAEGVVKCLEELLRKCRLNSVDQMVVLLKKLTYGAMLSPSEASEEFREGILLCVKALLLSLYSCSDMSCVCKQIPGMPALSGGDNNDRLNKTFASGSESGECVLAFLQSQFASAAIGHWLSLLLKTADTEAARGQQGSARLRIEAFKTLRVLVAKVGSADALAFFLPGIASQLAKVLHSAKIVISGPAGNVDSIDQAIRGFTEFLMIVLQDDANASALDIESSSDFDSNECNSTLSLLEELRHLQVKNCVNTKATEDTGVESEKISYSQTQLQETGNTDPDKENLSLHVNRTKDWMQRTSEHVNKLLDATFPHICIHPSQKVRKGLVDAIKGLLSECFYTLGESRLMLLECLCALVFDVSNDVSSTAQDFLEYLFSQNLKHVIKQNATEIFIRHLEKLPRVVLGHEESYAVLHAQKLLTIIFYSGPRLIVAHLQSPVEASRFLDLFAACLSHNSVFSGSLRKLTSTDRSSALGYLPSIAELKSGANFFNYSPSLISSGLSELLKCRLIEEKSIEKPVKTAYELPRMPPWFSYVGSLKLYQPLAWILRFVGLSLVADNISEGLMLHVIETLLGYFRKLVSELRLREYNEESWQSWYDRHGSGQLLRQASTAVCMLNEIIFGVSEQASNDFASIFHNCAFHTSFWNMPKDKGVRSYLVECIGGILHEYLSAEVWNVPIDCGTADLLHNAVVEEDISLYFFQDAAMLREVIIDGVGIFNLCLGRDFVSSGFLHSSLYLLLENLSSSNYRVRNSADSVLHILSTTSGFPTVGQLVLENADYVVDSICRQLRHLDLNHHVPNVLASMLSYIGVAHKILPLLEEPMRSVSMELEILGRHQHPDLTIPFLKAVEEIVKASKREAFLLPAQTELFARDVRSIISDSSETKQDQWEDILFKLNDSRRYRRTVGSIAGSCVTAAIPLLASIKQEICLAALDIIESGTLAIAKVEAAYKHERAIKEATEEALESLSLYQLKDTLEANEEGADENRLLPAMNKIWPFLVTCIQNRNPVAVRRCLSVISSVVPVCGGDFFTRRFLSDGAHFWKLLITSPFHKKSFSKDERIPLQLPYRSSSMSSEDSLAETSHLKVQIAVLNMIADLCRNKSSSSALELVLKKVSGLVVGIACSGVVGLRDASLNALHGIASIDPDLVWLLLADIYYTKYKENLPPPRPELPQISQILPPPMSPKEYLYVQYGGQSYGFDIDLASLDIAFTRFDSQHQMYS